MRGVRGVGGLLPGLSDMRAGMGQGKMPAPLTAREPASFKPACGPARKLAGPIAGQMLKLLQLSPKFHILRCHFIFLVFLLIYSLVLLYIKSSVPSKVWYEGC